VKRPIRIVSNLLIFSGRNLATVGVEGSNPFARAISDTGRNKTANATSKGERMSPPVQGRDSGQERPYRGEDLGFAGCFSWLAQDV
jgi:hypothetical protein